jgi:hypothetical protein
MPQVRFEPTIPVFEREKTVRALDRTATVIGKWTPTYIFSNVDDADRKIKVRATTICALPVRVTSPLLSPPIINKNKFKTTRFWGIGGRTNVHYLS